MAKHVKQDLELRYNNITLSYISECMEDPCLKKEVKKEINF